MFTYIKGRGGASTHEWAPPVDKLWIFWNVHAVQVDHFKSSEKPEPSLTLRVALNKSSEQKYAHIDLKHISSYLFIPSLDIVTDTDTLMALQ